MFPFIPAGGAGDFNLLLFVEERHKKFRFFVKAGVVGFHMRVHLPGEGHAFIRRSTNQSYRAAVIFGDSGHYFYAWFLETLFYSEFDFIDDVNFLCVEEVYSVQCGVISGHVMDGQVPCRVVEVDPASVSIEAFDVNLSVVVGGDEGGVGEY